MLRSIELYPTVCVPLRTRRRSVVTHDPRSVSLKLWLFDSFGGRDFGFGSVMIDTKPRLSDYC